MNTRRTLQRRSISQPSAPVTRLSHKRRNSSLTSRGRGEEEEEEEEEANESQTRGGEEEQEEQEEEEQGTDVVVWGSVALRQSTVVENVRKNQEQNREEEQEEQEEQKKKQTKRKGGKKNGHSLPSRNVSQGLNRSALAPLSSPSSSASSASSSSSLASAASVELLWPVSDDEADDDYFDPQHLAVPPRLPFSSITRYLKLEKLGEGNYGAVYKAEDLYTKEYCAMKKIKLEHEDDGIPPTSLREIALLASLSHAALVPLLDVVIAEKQLHLVFPYLDKDLRRYMDCVGDLPPLLVKHYMRQMLSGVHHCHQQRVLHRDLKPQNLLVNRKGELRIADFGLARSIIPASRKTITHEVATLWYRAPEILLGQRFYTIAMDMWAVGAIFAEISNDNPIFPGDSEIATLMKIFQLTGRPSNDNWPDVEGLPDYHDTFPNWSPLTLEAWCQRFPRLDPLGIDLLRRMLSLDPLQRITAEQALTHPYFDDLDEAEAIRLSEQISVQLDTNDGSERRRKRHARR